MFSPQATQLVEDFIHDIRQSDSIGRDMELRDIFVALIEQAALLEFGGEHLYDQKEQDGIVTNEREVSFSRGVEHGFVSGVEEGKKAMATIIRNRFEHLLDVV